MRFLLNIILTGVTLLVLNAFGWISLYSDGQPVSFDHLSWSVIGTLVLLALVIAVLSFIVHLAFGISVILTLGIALLAFPFIGWAILTLC